MKATLQPGSQCGSCCQVVQSVCHCKLPCMRSQMPVTQASNQCSILAYIAAFIWITLLWLAMPKSAEVRQPCIPGCKCGLIIKNHWIERILSGEKVARLIFDWVAVSSSKLCFLFSSLPHELHSVPCN